MPLEFEKYHLHTKMQSTTYHLSNGPIEVLHQLESIQFVMNRQVLPILKGDLFHDPLFPFALACHYVLENPLTPG